jgi:hypothetical protein
MLRFQASFRVSCELNCEIVTMPVLSRGVVRRYDVQNPQKLDKHTMGTSISMILKDSPSKFIIPLITKENMMKGRIKTINDFNNKLIEYRFAFISRLK